MKKIICLFGIVFILSAYGIAAAQINSITICTPEWVYYTQKDDKGLYHDLWKEVFQSDGIRLEIKYAPFKRCENTIKNKTKNFDAYAAGYASSGVVVPHWHLGIDLLTVVYKKGAIPKWNGEASLADKRVAWERGYDFDKHGVIKVKVKRNEFDKLELAFKMLLIDRLDFILDYKTEMQKVVIELSISDQVEIVSDVITGPKYYMIFADTEKGKKLAEIWDNGMERLHKSGQLHKMYEQYEDISY